MAVWYLTLPNCHILILQFTALYSLTRTGLNVEYQETCSPCETRKEQHQETFTKVELHIVGAFLVNPPSRSISYDSDVTPFLHHAASICLFDRNNVALIRVLELLDYVRAEANLLLSI